MDAKTNGASPAMPVIGAPGSPEDYPGLSKREAFAMAAMQGILAGSHPVCMERRAEEKVAFASLLMADALLAALSQEPQ